MTQLTVFAEPRRRRFDIVEIGVTVWLMMWAACVSASLFLLAR
jgi:hypothetical protein